MKIGDLVLIHWHDSRGAGAKWNFIDDVEKDGICQMQSVGWIIVKNKREICLAPHMGVEDDGDHQVCGEMHIPRSAIDKVVSLKNG